MADKIATRGFQGRRPPAEAASRVPPGQYVEHGFPVLSAGPTPRTSLDRWDFAIDGAVDRPSRWTWSEFRALPREPITRDIHCVTKWTKLDTHWQGVAIDTLLAGVELRGGFVIAVCDGGYTTNLALEDVTGGKAWLVDTYEGASLPPEHGGPVRLLVPHLYFWKSAKWVRGLRVVDADSPGFWEQHGYHNHGDPWREQRYKGD
jgi:DMSO/TMAO reductase YedYZ molybdopterin-dependent catalytic subunit